MTEEQYEKMSFDEKIHFFFNEEDLIEMKLDPKKYGF